MKKLGKINRDEQNTIEYYLCSCNGCDHCSCSCSCDQGCSSLCGSPTTYYFDGRDTQDSNQTVGEYYAADNEAYTNDLEIHYIPH